MSSAFLAEQKANVESYVRCKMCKADSLQIKDLQKMEGYSYYAPGGRLVTAFHYYCTCNNQKALACEDDGKIITNEKVAELVEV